MVDTAAILFSMAERLTTVSDKDFDMREWKCGTVGCAIGHCWDLIPGLKMGEFPLGLCPYYRDKIGYNAISEALYLDEFDVKLIFSNLSYERPDKKSVIERIRQVAERLQNDAS